MLIGEYFGHPVNRMKNTKGAHLTDRRLVGIELELEGVNIPSVPRNFSWVIERDGSLINNGREFILAEPRWGQDLEDSINQLYDLLDEGTYTLSSRTSTHIHMDVREMEPLEVFSVVSMFALTERILFNNFGQERVKSNFCLPLFADTQVFEVINQVLRGGVEEFVDALDKYSALNLRPMRTQGSIEFRFAQATKTREDMLFLLKTLYCIFNPSKEGLEVEDLLNQHNGMSLLGEPIDVIKGLFGGELMERLYYPGIEVDAKKGLRTLQELLLYRKVFEVDAILLSRKRGQRNNIVDRFIEQNDIGV